MLPIVCSAAALTAMPPLSVKMFILKKANDRHSPQAVNNFAYDVAAS